MLIKPKFVKTVAALGIAAAFACGSAFAAPFSAVFVPGTNVLSDDNAEIPIKFDATLNAGAGGYRAFVFGVDTIDVKDILVGIVGLTSFPLGALGTSASLYNEVTGIYAVEALTIAPLIPAACLSAALTTCSVYDFGPADTAGGLNAALALLAVYGIVVPVVANTTGDSIGAFFEDTTTDFTRTGATLQASFDSAYDGTETERFVLEMIGGDTFFTVAPANPAQLALVPVGSPAGSYGGSSTIGYQNVPGWTLGPDMEIIGNISRAAAGPFGIWTDSTFTVSATAIPEPGTLALLGLGLAGFGFAGLRRRKFSVPV